MTLTVLNASVPSVTDTLNAQVGLRVISPADWGPDAGLVTRGSWREIVGAGIGSRQRSMHDVRLEAGGRSVPLRHEGEAVYYVVEGDATVLEYVSGNVESHEVTEGSMIHIHGGATYQLQSQDGARLIGGPSPVADLDEAALPTADENAKVSVHHRDGDVLQVPFISKDARLVVWLGKGAVTANMNYVVLEPGERNKEHVHSESEDTIHILDGHGTAENVTTGERVPFGPGDTVHIEVGYWHALAADRGERVVSVGGPCPADIDMLRAAGVDVDDLIARYGKS